MIIPVNPIINYAVKGMCKLPYAGHPHGCPNFGVKFGCPPSAPKLADVYNLSLPCWCIINSFDLTSHVGKLRLKYPAWSHRQLYCCLYWQPTARKALATMVSGFKSQYPEYLVSLCPEALGLDVSATLANSGVNLEWPVHTKALQVAFAGYPNGSGLELCIR
jgi:hypothetical protein